MSRALYRKYRSKSLSEVVGQNHVTDILARSLAAGRIAHAYLLTGPKGVGKTSIARILAYEINKLPYNEDATNLDIIEIDAASNNSVEDVRELREKVQVAPVSAEKKIYIIDEVHMLSKAAFNALLKTLEEPPEHAVFILATTDADKLPATIISRTQRFGFRAISQSDAVKHLKFIADKEKINIDDDALQLIAKRGDGSFRDSISLLDQLRGLADAKTKITRQLIEESLGLASGEHVERLLLAYEAKDLKKIIELLDENDRSGIQPTVLVSQLVQAVREAIAEKPQLLPLLDQLLDVAKSSHPNIKLLTVLAAHAAPKPKIAALTALAPEISAPISELEKRAEKPLPKTDRAPQTIPSQNGFTPDPIEAPARVASGGAAPENTLGEDQKFSETDRTTGPAGSNTTSRPKGGDDTSGQRGERDNNKAGSEEKQGNLENLDWEKLIEYARQNFVAVYSVLSKCGFEIADRKLIIYTKTAFYKRKLDDSKYHVKLLEALTETGVGNVEVETIAAPPPPKDSTAAAVAAIMGGGEEVTVDV